MRHSRMTVYLQPEISRAAKVKAAVTEKTFSQVVNDALALALREDEADLAAFDSRKGEPSRSFEAVLKGLKRDGLI